MATENNNPQEEIAELREQVAAKEREITELREQVSAQEQALTELDGDDEDNSTRDVTLQEILENPEVTRAINTAVNAWANTKPDEMKLRFRSLHLGLAFSFLILLAIGTLGYLGVLTKDVTGSLIGALVGYWYGRQQGK
jgi:hypothetical protein